jgi:hypothetical protein
MLYPSFDAFNITKKEKTYLGYIAEEDFFLLLQIEDEVSEEEGNDILRIIKGDVLNSHIEHLHDFDTILGDKIKQLNLPVQSSLAAGFLKGDVLFLKTTNRGNIYLNRGSHFANLLSGNNTASGILHFHDFLIATTDNASDFFEKQGDEFTRHLHGTDPRTISQKLLSSEDAITEQYPAALFIRIEKREDIIIPDDMSPDTTINSNNNHNVFDETTPHVRLKTQPSKKVITAIAAAVLGVILVWSVGLGYQRREQQKKEQLVTSTRSSITKKLDEAADIAFLNTERAVELIQESKDELMHLKNQVGTSKIEDIETIEKAIKQREEEITKKEEKSFTEFYDLTLDSKEAEGSRMYLSGGSLAILDTTNGKIYTLSLAKKSLDTNKNGSIKKATLVASSDDTIFFVVPTEGIYRIDKEGKTTKVIDDKNLDGAKDIAIYNSNIYILDPKKGNVYKYIASADGFSKSSSYFGGVQDFKDSNSLAIDSAVYIDKGNVINKYSAGILENFKTTFPDRNVHIQKVITNAELDKVYAWDKDNSKLYILGKDGAYIGQVQSEILKEGDDVTIFGNNAYILRKEKVYNINLD